MKKYTNLGKTVTYLILLAMFGCSKSPITNPPGGGPQQPQPPNVTMKATPDSLYWDQTTTINWTSDKIVTVKGVTGLSGSFTVEGPFNVGNNQITTTASYIDGNGQQKTLTRTVSITAWSEKTRQLVLRGKVKSVLIRSCIAGTQNSPNPEWIDGSSTWPPNWWGQFFPNGTMLVSNSTNLLPWAWTDWQETAINFGGSSPVIWNVELTSNGFKRWKIENGFYIEQWFESM